MPIDRCKGSPYRYRAGCLLAAALLLLAANARADDIVAVYAAYWAGLPAGEIQVRLHDGAAAYHDEIEIRTTGLPALITRLRGTGIAEGRLAADRPAEPSHYDAIYDLWKRRNSHISMRFVTRAGAVVAERGRDDTSRKPPLAEKFRSNAVDPVTAFERVRDALLRVELTLRAIAGFKGESSEDGDPDDAPRKVDLLVTDDARMMPLSMTVPVFFMPLVVQFVHFCALANTCPGKEYNENRDATRETPAPPSLAR